MIEEYIFRYSFFEYARRTEVKFAGVINTAIFTLIHGFGFEVESFVPMVIRLIAFGVFVVGMFKITGSIVVALILHGTLNLANILIERTQLYNQFNSLEFIITAVVITAISAFMYALVSTKRHLVFVY